ncbi:MAG: CoA transferase [Chloroflexi bacterium]|nr:CoA transferase [Chloroflexota bacterium]
MAKQALSWLKVVELGEFIAAPYCTKLMADMGAEVVKIEEPNLGDRARRHGPFLKDVPHPERSGLFLNMNTSKLGITLNVQKATGRELLRRLLEDADVFVESNHPKKMKALGLDYKSLRKVNPRLIVTSITPFGQTGPYKGYKAYDINCSAAGGISVGIGSPDREPLTMPFSQCDHQAGVSAAAATYVALAARNVTGEGQQVDIAEAEVMAALHLGIDLYDYLEKGHMAKRSGFRDSQTVYPSTTLQCKDGYVRLRAPQLAQWIRFLGIMGTPEWTKDPRYRNRHAMGMEYPQEVDDLLAPWLMAHTKAEIFEMCLKERVPLAPVNTIAEEVDNPHLKDREFWVEVKRDDTGPVTYAGAPYKFSVTPWGISRPAPRLGEHNEEVYCGRLGYSKEDLVQLRRAGVI